MTSDSSNTESQAARQELVGASISLVFSFRLIIIHFQVRTAVSFLQNPKVQNTPLAKKQEFLQRKGLTNDEIKKACELSGAYQQHEQQMKIPPPLPIAMNGNQLQLTFFHKLKEILHNLAVLSIVGYTLYKFYQVKDFLIYISIIICCLYLTREKFSQGLHFLEIHCSLFIW